MSDFKRHLPSDNGVHSMHVALNRIWDALEGKTGNASTTPVVNFIGGGSSLSVSPSSGGTTYTNHNLLPGLQGGDTDNYWHLTSSEYTGTGTGTFVRVNSPVFTGVPSAPTVILSDNSTSLATTAFVKGQGYLVAGISNASPLMNGPVAPGTSPNVSRYDHVHPSDTTKATDTLVVHLAGTETITGDKTFTGLVNADEIRFTAGITPANTLGTTYWDADSNTLATIVDVTNGVTLQHGQEVMIRCVNKTGSIITDGQVVYVNDAQGNRPTAALAKADSITTSMCIGVATQHIAVNAEGFVTTIGLVHGYDTRAFTDGQKMYLSVTTAGLLTPTVPVSPGYLVMVATALNSTVVGSIFVHPEQPIALDGTMAANSDLVSPSQKAVATLVGGKLTSTLTSSYIFVGNASNVATGVAVTGDASLSNTGVLGVNKTRLNVRNETGTTLASTKAVYITGYSNFPLVTLASNTDEAKHNIIGVTIAPIAHQADGFIATSGQCNAETNGWVVGTELYASTSGALVSTEPTSGEVKHVGIVTVQANYPAGKILLYGGFEGSVRGVGAGQGLLDRLGDDIGATAWSLRNYSNTEVAKITSLGALTALTLAKTGGTSTQFLKADGTVDSTLYTALPTTTAVASATLTAGQWVNFHNVAGVKNVRPSGMTDATKPAQGFVLAGFASASTATVYLAGVNSVIPVGSYVAADVGKPAFLSTAGGTTLTPPASTGNYLQQVGWIDSVGATVTVSFSKSAGIVRA